MSYGNILDSLLLGLGRELDRVESRMYDLIQERRPLVTTELLTEYENEFGIPEEGTSLASTTAERQATVNTRILLTGRNDKKYFSDLASNLGYKIVIGEYTPSWCGIMQCGDSIQTQKMIHYWVVGVLPNTTIDMIDALKKQFDLYKPAHTVVLYAFYGGEFGAAFGDGFDHIEETGTDNWGGGFSLHFNNNFDVNLNTILPVEVYNGAEYSRDFSTAFWGFNYITTN